jgi:hypothetical protein
MDWIRRGKIALVPVFVLSTWASASFGLEKTPVRIGDLDRANDWDVATVCQVAYYNYCTGWIWVWGGWSPYEVVGVCYETCCPAEAQLRNTGVLVYTAAPPGRGFTGTIDIWAADANCCPWSSLASDLFLPYSGWNSHDWGDIVVPPSFVVTVTMAGHGLPSRFASDRPAGGPTGPPACGTCYQLHRLTHSYYFGLSNAMLCPGETMDDGVCDVEWIWDVALSCESSVGAGEWFGQRSSWAAVKELYR